jgi:flagellar hook-length control protein FliK
VPTNAQVHPGEVVAQIAHQADLYRLPGNKGVRINLHPEDLGGVQVTLRYAAGGSLELHINVEHATTGALVQAGWTELRDALATQGIGPERLVMSITGPSGANQLDFSSNGGGSNRPDSGLAAFTQGGDSASSQQRQDNGSGAENWRAGRGWSNGVDSPSASDDTPRSSSGVSTSRIDYRV